MYRVVFLPSEISVEVEEGTLISEAAIKAGIEDFHLPCGGKGTCGKCLVEVVSGSYQQLSTSTFDKAIAGGGLVMACQTKIREDIVVKLTQSHSATMKVLGDSHLLVSEDLLPNQESITPLARVEKITVPPASIEEHYSDWQRLVKTLNPDGHYSDVVTDINLLWSLAEALREQDGKVTVLVQEENRNLRVCEIHSGHIDINIYGIAVDIGTTTVAVHLVDLSNGKVLDSRTSYNLQIRRGADIISRIDYAKTPNRRLELRNLILETINELLDNIIMDLSLNPNSIRAGFLVGNTTMIHLLLALIPKYIRETPYVPTVNNVPVLNASDVGLIINPQAVINFSPGVGSYVGGDITAGLLCTNIPKQNDEVALFLDIGTNGEIVLGNADWMVACACSAGPAFEGSGIKCGMRAIWGAIEYLEISEDGKDVKFDVIGDGKPAGICGSGLICLLGELLTKGIIDQMGNFNTEINSDRIIKTDSSAGFVLEWGENTADGNDLIITEPDIENLIRTKAAIYAACYLILKNVGIDWSCVSKIIIAGGFGRYIHIHDAVLIGLLPDLPYETFSYVGNSALTGAYIALLSRDSRVELSEIANKMTYIDLSSDSGYMDSYVAALFLPHTDMSLFPNVAKHISIKKTSV
ncbi:MAG: ASKHA domain-containing protein [Armatimonadota bacterium]